MVVNFHNEQKIKILHNAFLISFQLAFTIIKILIYYYRCIMIMGCSNTYFIVPKVRLKFELCSAIVYRKAVCRILIIS